MKAPVVPRRGPRTVLVLVGVLVVAVVLAVGGLVLDLPLGLGGAEVALVAAPVVLAVLVLTVVLHRADARDERDRDD